MKKTTIRKHSRGAVTAPRKARRIAALPTRAERLAAGQALRDKISRKSHGEFIAPRDHRDPIRILEKSNHGRLPELVPIRHGRMLLSPFTFLRGSAAVMAYDLAKTPVTGLRVQACGDCHLMNFGLFATPERNLVFDVNDFDETHPAPWEWDLKRLAASFVVAGRDNKLSEQDSLAAVIECVRSYREHLREYSRMGPLEVWYTRLDIADLIAMAPDAKARKLQEGYAVKPRRRVIEHFFPKIVGRVDGGNRLFDKRPVPFQL